MKPLNFLCAIILACTLFSCQKSELTSPVTEGQVSVNDTSNLLAIQGQKAVSVDVDANIGGYLESLPSGYSLSTKKYPLLVYLHGVGELGNGTTDLWKVEKNSVPRLLYDGVFPKSFTVGGETFSFIVVCPQFKNYPKSGEVNNMVNYAIKHYRVDTTRMYVTGLSLGGGATMDYTVAYGSRLAAIVPMCESSYPTTTKALSIAKTGVAVWAFHNDYDTRVPSYYTKNFIAYINDNNPAIPAIKTIFNASSHNCWKAASNPNYKENNMNIYEWMLQHKR